MTAKVASLRRMTDVCSEREVKRLAGFGRCIHRACGVVHVSLSVCARDTLTLRKQQVGRSFVFEGFSRGLVLGSGIEAKVGRLL